MLCVSKLPMHASTRSPTTIIYPAAFAMAFALTQVALGLIFFARDIHHAQPGPIGWLAGTWALTYTIGCVVLRPRVRHLSAPNQVLIAAASLAAIFAGMQFAPNLLWLFALQGLFGLMLSLYWPALLGWLSTGAEGADLGRLVSRFNLMWSTGNIFGPYACGWLLHVHVRLPLIVGSAVLLGTALFVALATRERPRPDATPAEVPVPPAPAVDRSTPLRYPAWVGHFAAYFTVGALMGAFPVGAREQLGYSETLIGFIFFIRAIANTVAFVGMGHSSAWHFRMGPMLVGQVLMLVAFVGLIGNDTLVPIIILMSVANFAVGITYSASIFHGASGSLDRAHRMAIHEALIGVGLFIGSAAGGVAYTVASLNGVYIMSALVLAVGTVIQTAVGRHHARP